MRLLLFPQNENVNKIMCWGFSGSFEYMYRPDEIDGDFRWDDGL